MDVHTGLKAQTMDPQPHCPLGETGPHQRAPQAGKPLGGNQSPLLPTLTLSHANQLVQTHSPANDRPSKGPSWLTHSVYTLRSVAGLDGAKPRSTSLPSVPRRPQPLCAQRRTTAKPLLRKERMKRVFRRITGDKGTQTQLIRRNQWPLGDEWPRSRYSQRLHRAQAGSAPQSWGRAPRGLVGFSSHFLTLTAVPFSLLSNQI